MEQPVEKKPRFNSGGFAFAAALAPGMAALICFVGAAVAALSFTLDDIGRLIGSLLFLMVIVSFWGILPSVLFGGLVLSLIQKFWPGRPRGLVFVAGGGLAASLYVATGLATQHLSPGAAMLFAPWATAAGAQEPSWVWASLILSGLCAGLIYAAFAKRG